MSNLADSGIVPEYFVQDGDPGDAPKGSLWYDTSDNKVYVYVDSTKKWVNIATGTTTTTTTSTTTTTTTTTPTTTTTTTT